MRTPFYLAGLLGVVCVTIGSGCGDSNGADFPTDTKDVPPLVDRMAPAAATPKIGTNPPRGRMMGGPSMNR